MWLVSESALADGMKGIAKDGVGGTLIGSKDNGRDVCNEVVA